MQSRQQVLVFLLQDMARKEGKTVIIVTHNAAIAPIANRVIQMHDGKIKQIDNNSQPEFLKSLIKSFLDKYKV